MGLEGVSKLCQRILAVELGQVSEGTEFVFTRKC